MSKHKQDIFHGKRDNQSGIGTAQMLLIVMVALAISGVGWLGYRHSHLAKTDNDLPSSSRAANKQPILGDSESAQKAVQYLVIKEWGVESPYSANLTLTYKMSPDGTAAVFSSSQLSNLSSECVGRGGAIKRWASTDKVTNGYRPSADTPTAATHFAKADPSTYTHVGKYYYTFQRDQAACGNPRVTSNLYSQTNDAVKSLIPNLQTISN